MKLNNYNPGVSNQRFCPSFRYIPCILFLIVLVAWISPMSGKIKTGNDLYKEGLYDDAIAKYTEALSHLPDSPHIHFNIGNAYYMKENYEDAIKYYAEVTTLVSDDTMLESKAYYNLGNCKYRQGKLKENTNLNETISFYRESLDYYRDALKSNPGDKNAKYNYEFVERKMKELMDKQKQQEKQENGKSGEGDSGKPKEESKEAKAGEQGGTEQQDDEEESSKDEAKGQQQEAQMAQGMEQESEEKEELTAEEAQILLDSLKDEELPRLQPEPGKRSYGRVLKDW